MPDEADADLPEVARRELAARRRELEREFDLKRAELKAQHQRRLDLLRQEQAEWQEHRRRQAKELADRTEKVRRNTENAQQRVELGTAVREELEQRRQEVRQLEREAREAGRLRARLEAEAAAARRLLQSARRRSGWAAATLGAGTLAWLAAGWQAPLGLAALAGGLALSFLLCLGAGWTGPGRGAEPTDATAHQAQLPKKG